MLRRFTRALVRIITNTFFRRIDIVGLENVPETGAVIFAAERCTHCEDLPNRSKYSPGEKASTPAKPVG